MDYTEDTCMDTFTQGQKDRMQAIMAGSPRRMELNASIGCQAPTTVTFTLAASPATQTNCGSDDVTYTVDMTALNGFSETTTFSATGNPGGSAVSFAPTTLNVTGSTTMTVSGLTGATDGSYPMIITGTSASETKTANVTLVVGTGVCQGQATPDYATSVTRVNFNTIDHTSLLTGADNGTTAYSDFTATQSTTVNRESDYPLTIQVNTDGGYTVASKVWIDWNQNCLFDVATEEYDLGTANGVANGATGNSPLSVTVPANAVLGNTIMRVVARFTGSGGGTPGACVSNTDGEVEDYRIIVANSLSVAKNQFSMFDVFPVPTNGELILTLGTSKNVNVALHDIRGRGVYAELHRNSSDVFTTKLDFSAIASGVYMLEVKSGSKRAVKKIVIQ